MVDGLQSSEDEPASDLYLLRQKQNVRDAYPISVELINRRTEEARSLCTALYINPIEYDLSAWTRSFASHALKLYPSPSQPNPAGSQNQRKKPKEV
jgi:hypothetical protein